MKRPEPGRSQPVQRLLVRREVTDRGGGLAELLVEEPEVVVRVEEVRVGRERALVRLRRLAELPAVLERDAEVECGGGVLRVRASSAIR